MSSRHAIAGLAVGAILLIHRWLDALAPLARQFLACLVTVVWASARPQFEALRVARRRESTATRGETYARRAGIGGTRARGIRRCRPRRTCYRGRPKVQFGHILAATRRNFLRLGEWFVSTPRRRARPSPFARLLAEPVTG